MSKCSAIVVALFLSHAVPPPQAVAQVPAKAPAIPGARPASAAISGDESTIRQSAQSFAEAFNRGDAKAIAAQWMDDGNYIDEDGAVYAGRAAIESEYARFFKELPGLKVKVAVDSVKLLSPDAAIEEGRVTLDPPPSSGAGQSKYTAVHVKRDGKWLMATVRDDRVGEPPATNDLSELDWMIGDWRAEESGVAAEVSCQWLANRTFLQRSYHVGSHRAMAVSSTATT
jgi:uncharacterized protein (TIGR02246 family)